MNVKSRHSRRCCLRGAGRFRLSWTKRGLLSGLSLQETPVSPPILQSECVCSARRTSIMLSKLHIKTMQISVISNLLLFCYLQRCSHVGRIKVLLTFVTRPEMFNLWPDVTFPCRRHNLRSDCKLEAFYFSRTTF